MNDGRGRRVVEVEFVNENFLHDRRLYSLHLSTPEIPLRGAKGVGKGIGWGLDRGWWKQVNDWKA